MNGNYKKYIERQKFKAEQCSDAVEDPEKVEFYADRVFAVIVDRLEDSWFDFTPSMYPGNPSAIYISLDKVHTTPKYIQNYETVSLHRCVPYLKEKLIKERGFPEHIDVTVINSLMNYTRLVIRIYHKEEERDSADALILETDTGCSLADENV